MRFAKHVQGLLAILLVAPVAGQADSKPAEVLAQLKRDLETAIEALESGRKLGTTEAEKKAAADHYFKEAAAIGRRALALAESNPGAPEALEALVWITDSLGFNGEMRPVLDTAYDLLASRYLDREELLPLIRTAWTAGPLMSTHAEALLRAAAERSSSTKVRALACLTLGRYMQNLAVTARDFDHPQRGPSLREWFGPERVGQIRGLKPQDLRREAEALFERTIREFADLRPMGKDYPPLGEQARGDLFRLRHLEPGCTVPQIEGEDIDGKPMKLSDFRGKVIVISFWATWCGPCMGMVPDEEALVERMKGRPLVLIGVNGDEDRSAAKRVAAEKGINWRSFWDGRDSRGIAAKWGVHAWPTVYLIDTNGVIRDGGPRVGRPRSALDKAVEDLVAEAEAKRPRSD